jgi:1,4-dihydroxy-2-naphthoate octaprenyltransferase
MKLLKAVLKLMRFKPVISWTVCGFMLALSVAYHETGALQNSDLLVASFIAVVLIQGVISHAMNDLCDEDVDRNANIDETGRTKVLINGMATRSDLRAFVLSALFISLMVFINVYNRLGYIILLFGFIGLYAAICYNVRPLKLGWRPFSEWTVVYPVITTLVVAVNYIATEHVSFLAFIVGTSHAFFNIRWFMDSRMMDIQPDSEHGKITTSVFLRMHNIRGDITDFYTLLMCLIFACILHSGFTVMIIPLMIIVGWCYMRELFDRRNYMPWGRSRDYYVKSRLIGMRLTVINTVIMSLWLLFRKVYIL